MSLSTHLQTMHLVLTTCADQASADQMARHLLEQRLAACISLLPITSYYHWQGDLQQEQEVQMAIKTSAEQLPRLLEVVTHQHSYEVPELVVLEASAAGSYGDWLLDAVNPCLESQSGAKAN